MIHKISRRYALLKLIVKFIHKLYYRKIFLSGLENIPTNAPIIFGPNHQNALMDPLALIFNIPLQPVFLARADIFKSALIRRILRFLKILPIYRVRDGIKSLSNNSDTFNESIGVLEANKALALFPEAKHNNKHYLLPLKKGIPRIALLAEEKNNFDLNLHLIPVGIHYSNYYNANSDLWVNIGKPILVDKLKETYYKNPQQTHIILRDKIAEGIKPLILNIENFEFYDEYLLIITLLEHEMQVKLSLPEGRNEHALRVQQEIVKHIDQLEISERENTLKHANKINSILQIHGLNANDLSHENKVSVIDILRLIFTLPLFIIGISCSTPHIITSWFFYRKLTDRQFESSIKFVFQLIMSPIFNGVVAFYILPQLSRTNILVSTGVFFLLFYLGSYALNYFHLLQKALRRLFISGSLQKVNALIIEHKKAIKNTL